MSVNVDMLRRPISADLPCGPDLSGIPEYSELDVAARGKPELQYGNTIQSAEEPDWVSVEKQCVELFSKSKDLRVLTYLAVALLRRQGYPGLCDGLALLRYTVEDFWDGVYPLLDPEDFNDPTERRNIIESLSPSEETVDQFLRVRERLLDAPLCESRRFGRVGLRQILWASGENTPPSGDEAQVPDAGMIQAAFDDATPDDLNAQAKALETAAEHLNAINVLLKDRIGDEQPSLASLSRWIGRAAKELNTHLARRGLGSAKASQQPETLPNQPSNPASAAISVVRDSVPGTIKSHDDVRKSLDSICEYYARQEPSSPIPLLLKRAHRLVGLSFADIIRDLSPDALHQIEVIGGPLDNGGQS